MATDLANNTSTTGVVTVGGGPVVGQTDGVLDSDWYAVTLVAGVTYQFSTWALDLDPLLTLRDATGASLFGGSSSIYFTAEQSGTYYLDASRNMLTASGEYFLSANEYVAVLGPSDIAGSAATTAALTIGGPAVAGAFEDFGDSDWYSVHLEAGHTYELFASSGFSDTPYVILRDAAGQAISHSMASPNFAGNNYAILNNNFSYGNILFTATETGDYFLDVQTRSPSSSDYDVQAYEFVPSNDPFNGLTTTATLSTDGAPTSGVFEAAADSDWYRVNLSAGVTYAFTINTTSFSTIILRDQSGLLLDLASVDVGSSPTFTFTPTTSGDYFLDASTRSFLGGTYQLSVQPTVPNPADLPGDDTTAANLPLDGLQLRGVFEEGPDSDWYRVELTARVTYQFDLAIFDALGPLGAEYRTALGLMDANGHELQSSVEIVGGSGSGPMIIVYTAEQSGTYYLDARSLFSGNYRITGREYAPIPGDTVGVGPNAAADLPVDGVPVVATIEDFGDRDWYAVTLVEGHSYRFTATGETDSFPEFQLRSPSGIVWAQAFGNGSINASDPTQQDFTFTPFISGTYYLDLTGVPGDFEIVASDVSTSDTDVPGDVTTPETLEFDVPVDVTLGSFDDSDWYAVQLVAGESYSIRLSTPGFSAADCELRDASGQLLVTGIDDRNMSLFFPQNSSFIHYTASASGTYYVSATGRPGPYTLDIVPDDYGDNAAWAASLDPGVTHAGFENYFDADFFSLNVEAGKIYTVSWAGTLIGGRLTIDDEQMRTSSVSYTFSATDSAPIFAANYFDLDPTATYSITLTERTDIIDTHGDTLTDATPVQLGAVTAGAIEAFRDHDMLKVELEAGKTYSFDVARVGTQLSRYQFDIMDADGAIAASSTSFGPSSFHFAAMESGTYYLDVSNYRSSFLDESIGAYTVKISEDSAARTPVTAVDGGGVLASNIVKVFFAGAGFAYPRTVITRGDGVANAWSAEQKAAVQAVLDRYENAINIQFVEVSSAAEANFVLVNDPEARGTFFGGPGTPNAGLGVFGLIASHSAGDGGANVERIAQAIGRGLGLKAPQDLVAGDTASAMYNVRQLSSSTFEAGLFDLNQTVFTVMSSFGGWAAPPPFDQWTLDRSQITLFGRQIGPAALDIAALQVKYGANTSFASGNDVYTLVGTNGEGTSWQALWDTGGQDEIRYDGFRDTLINLNDATGRYEEGGGGFVSNVAGVHGGFTIARGVTIENARGGSGDDMLVGNEAANRLWGNGGDDLLDGGAGNDVLDGGAGMDTAIYAGASAAVVVSLDLDCAQNTGGAGRDTLIRIENLVGSDFADRLIGSRGNNVLTGGDGNDRLEGLDGDDRLIGGDGDDLALGGKGADVFVANAGDGNDRYDGGGGGRDLLDASVIAEALTVNLILGRAQGAAIGSDVLIGIEDATGGSGNDTFIANTAANRFAGGAGADIFVFGSNAFAGLLENRDRIADYRVGSDQLDVRGIDANQSVRGDQAFVFAGLITSVDDGLGELARGAIGYRYSTDRSGLEHTLIEANTGGSREADLQIDLIGHHLISSGDLLL